MIRGPATRILRTDSEDRALPRDWNGVIFEVLSPKSSVCCDCGSQQISVRMSFRMAMASLKSRCSVALSQTFENHNNRSELGRNECTLGDDTGIVDRGSHRLLEIVSEFVHAVCVEFEEAAKPEHILNVRLWSC